MPSLLLALSSACKATPVVSARIHSDDAEVRALIREGLARSATLRALDNALRTTDVVVYVQPSVMRSGLGGYVPHRVAATAAARYVLVVISPEGSTARRISVIGHELQHALEIATTPQVGRTQTAAELFDRIGFRSHNPRNAFETMEALFVERAVRHEWLESAERRCAIETSLGIARWNIVQ
jgi:hypothetical protein